MKSVAQSTIASIGSAPHIVRDTLQDIARKAGHDDIGDVLHQKALVGFLHSYDDIGVAAPHEMLETIVSIWEEANNPDELLHPKALEKKLAEHYLAKQDVSLSDLPAISVEGSNTSSESLIDDVLAVRYQPESLTGTYSAKPIAPLMLGLAHLYAVTVGAKQEVDVVNVKADYSNMGNTNKYFAERAGSPDDPMAGHKYTDSAARICANIALDAFKEIKGVTLHGVRSGGDELDLVITGANEATVEQHIYDVVQPRIEAFIADALLQDHPHSKYPLEDKDGNDIEANKYRCGFGMALGCADMKHVGNAKTDISDIAEKRVDFGKIVAGYGRYGKIPPLLETAAKDSPELNETLSAFKDKVLSFKEEELDKRIGNSEHLRISLKGQGYNGDPGVNTAEIEQFSRLIGTAENIMSDSIGNVYGSNKSYSQCNVTDITQPAIYAELTDNNDRFIPQHFQAQHAFDALFDNANLDNNHRNILVRLAEGNAPIDPVTNTFTDRDLPANVMIFANDAKALSEEYDKGKSKALYFSFSGVAAFNKINLACGDVLLENLVIFLILH